MVLQRGVDSVGKRSKEKKMLLNVSKNEITFFSRHNREASWETHCFAQWPSYAIQQDSEVSESLPGSFLELRPACRGSHKKVISRCNILLALANKSWGWTTSNLRKVYVALQLSVMNYAAPSWSVCTDTNLDKLEQSQNKALLQAQ